MKKLNIYLKCWLNNNQIYFTTIASVLLGIMAIIVSIQTKNIAKIQTNIAKRQLQIDRFEHLPNISIEHKYLGITDTVNLVRSHELKIFNNDGGKYKNLEIKVVGSFDINIQDPDSLRKDLKLNGKYITLFIANTYNIHKLKYDRNEINLINHINAGMLNKVYSSLSRKIYDNLKKRYDLDCWGPIENFIYAELKYLDFMNELNYEYYDIYSEGESTLLAVSNVKLDYVQIPDRQIYLDMRNLDTNNFNKVVDKILDMSLIKKK